MVTKGLDGRWYKPCPSCGEMQSYLRKGYAEESLRSQKECKSCSNKKTDNCSRGFYEDIRLSWFNKFKTGAEVRNLAFNLTPEYLWELFKEYLDKKHIEMAAEKYVDTLIDYGMDDIQLKGMLGVDKTLDAAIQYYLEMDQDDYEDEWDN